VATLTTQVVTRLGVAPTYAAAAGGGDKFVPDATTFIQVKNGSGGALTVTVAPTKVPLAGLTETFAAVSIPATTGDKMIGPFPAEHFAGSDGLADITYSGVTSLTVAVVKVSQP